VLIVVEDKDKVCAPDVVQGMKNKTMEEIINKWTGELDRCGEEFKAQATDIRRWDAILVENGDKVPPNLTISHPFPWGNHTPSLRTFLTLDFRLRSYTLQHLKQPNPKIASTPP
jgi:Nsp1-like C-terminal region